MQKTKIQRVNVFRIVLTDIVWPTFGDGSMPRTSYALGFWIMKSDLTMMTEASRGDIDLLPTGLSNVELQRWRIA